MEMNELVTLFGNGFFPCIMCAALFWYMIKQNESHKSEMDAMKDVINEVKIALTELKDAINKIDREIDKDA